MPLAPPPNVLENTPIYRIIHIDNLPAYLSRLRIHAPNHMPNDGLAWRSIEDKSVQGNRYTRALAIGPGGTILDYVPFYFGPLSPMLLRLATHWEVDYDGPQEDIIYLVSTVQEMIEGEHDFVFSDGHGLAGFSSWYVDTKDLCELDWPTIYAKIWKDTSADNDRKRRKQAEFLVHRSCGWNRILEIGVMTERAMNTVNAVLNTHKDVKAPPVCIRNDWYYQGK